MAVSSVGLRLKCDCSGKAQKQFNSKLQTRFLVREDSLKAEQRSCPTKEEQNKLWSRVPKGGPIPRLTGRLTVGRKKNSQLQRSPRCWCVALRDGDWVLWLKPSFEKSQISAPRMIALSRSRGCLVVMENAHTKKPQLFDSNRKLVLVPDGCMTSWQDSPTDRRS
jgi:hypothetical protein